MAEHSRTIFRIIRRVPAGGSILMIAALGFATYPSSGQTFRGLRIPIPDEQNRVAALITGDSGRQMPDSGATAIQGLRIETYRYVPEQEVDLIIEAPACQYRELRVVSDGEIRLRSGDSRLNITGMGFEWDYESSLLTISNEVHAVAGQAARLPGSAGAGGLGPGSSQPLVIDSRQLRYDLAASEAEFAGVVYVYNLPGMLMSCEWLQAALPGRIDQPTAITARTNLVVDLMKGGRETHITGEYAEYTAGPTNRTARITGHPTWESGPANGRGKEMRLDLDQQRFQLQGDTELVLNPEAESPRPPITVRAESYEWRDDRVEFQDNVSLLQTNRLAVASQKLTAILADRERLREVQAANGVQITAWTPRQTVHATGDRAICRGLDTQEEVLLLEGSPTWKTEHYAGSGREIELHPREVRYLVRGAATAALLPVPDESSAGANTNESTPIRLGGHPVQITAAYYEITEAGAHFFGGVEVRHPDWDLTSHEVDFQFGGAIGEVRRITALEAVKLRHLGTAVPPPADPTGGLFGSLELSGTAWTLDCRQLGLRLASGAGNLEGLEAEGEVVLRREPSRAEGGRLIYRPAEDRVELRDRPFVLTENQVRMTGESGTIFVYEREAGQLRAFGPYRIRVPSEVLERQAPQKPPAESMSPAI